jgi:hypothetical protein
MRTFIRRYILDSPLLKTASFAIGTVLTGILSGTFVSEITRNGEIVWSSFYTATSFYALIIIIAMIFVYYRELYLYDRDILRFKDNEFCLAYVRSQCLPAAVEMYSARIRAGDIGELEEAMREVRRILK